MQEKVLTTVKKLHLKGLMFHRTAFLKVVGYWLLVVDWFVRTITQEQGTVFQTAALLGFINPETSSRVTLAALGTVFQTGLLSCCIVVY